MTDVVWLVTRTQTAMKLPWLNPINASLEGCCSCMSSYQAVDTSRDPDVPCSSSMFATSIWQLTAHHHFVVRQALPRGMETCPCLTLSVCPACASALPPPRPPPNTHTGLMPSCPSCSLEMLSSRTTCASSYRQQPSRRQQHQQQQLAVLGNTSVVRLSC